MTLLKINRLLPIYISIVPLKFEVDIQSQSKVRVRKPKNSNMAARRPFWKWHRWKSIGFCLWPPSTCIWNLKLKFQSKLDLCSGNHVVYRQTDRRTDGRTRWIQYTPPPTSLGGGIMMVSLLRHIWVTRPQWVNTLKLGQCGPHCRWHFQINFFFVWKCYAFNSKFTEIWYQGSSWQYARTGSYNGLVLNRWQAIIWPNDGLVY